MVSHEHRCIFIHQRKCAGTSVINHFGLTLTDPEWHYFNDGLMSENPCWSSVKTDYAGYTVFSIVRNPWDRFISAWKYLPSTRDRDIEDVLNNLPEKGHDFRHITRPQSAILLDRNGDLITDDLIYFENLQEGFTAFCKKNR